MKRVLFCLLAFAPGFAPGQGNQVPARAPATASTPEPAVTIDALLDPASQASTGVTGLRAQMLTEGGRTAGFRGGMTSRSRFLASELDRRAARLDQLFQFATVIGSAGTLPPVIVEAKDVASFAPDQIRTADHVYKIEREERFVSVPPTWRDYLLTGLSLRGGNELPVFEARPKDAGESVVWRDAVRAGWSEGELQANAVLEANFHRLTRDFTGMLLYASLRQQGIVTGTRVAESAQTATGDRKQLVVGDRLRRVTDKALFVVDPRKWRPSVKGEKRAGSARSNPR